MSLEPPFSHHVTSPKVHPNSPGLYIRQARDGPSMTQEGPEKGAPLPGHEEVGPWS